MNLEVDMAEQLRIELELEKYKQRIEPLIKNILSKPKKKFEYEPTLLGDNSESNIQALTIAHDIRQNQMKEGLIAQTIIGNFPGWEDLGQGHSTGLDCRKLDNSIILDSKNKYNTCNSGSEKSLKEKLYKYKIQNPNTRCIWAIINPESNCKNLSQIINYNGIEIEKIQGKDLLKLIFQFNGIDYSDDIITFVRSIMFKEQ